MSQDRLDPVIHAPARTRLMMTLAGRERSQGRRATTGPEATSAHARQRSLMGTPPKVAGSDPAPLPRPEALSRTEGLWHVVCLGICAWVPAQAAPSLVPPVPSVIAMDSSEPTQFRASSASPDVAGDFSGGAAYFHS
jgi:hypothetical protein